MVSLKNKQLTEIILTKLKIQTLYVSHKFIFKIMVK